MRTKSKATAGSLTPAALEAMIRRVVREELLRLVAYAAL
jgi:hypothetical protein